MSTVDEKQDEQREAEERELRLLEQLCAAPTSVAGQVFEVTSLRDSLGDTFRELAQQYGGLLDRALERQAYKVDHDISEGLQSLAVELGLVKAAPRDVVELHVTALKARTSDGAANRRLAYVEEGRLMVLELMGCLASYYRNYFLANWQPNGPASEKAGNPEGERE